MLDMINSRPRQQVLVHINNIVIRKQVLERTADPDLHDGPRRYLQDDVSALTESLMSQHIKCISYITKFLMSTRSWMLPST